MAMAMAKAAVGRTTRAARQARVRPTPQPDEVTNRAGNRRRWYRHLAVAAGSGLLVALFWASRPNWVAEMRLWKAFGDASFMLLVSTLALGPLARLWPRVRPALRWRRQIGIWFALTASVHGLLILDGWARWSLRRFLGYELVPQLGREVRLEPGFGLANLIGLSALALGLVLAATSSDRAVRALGRPAWSWLHRLSQTVLVLSLLHGSYYLFIHFTASFHRVPPGLDWFRVPFLLLGTAVLALEAIAFVTTARKARAAKPLPG